MQLKIFLIVGLILKSSFLEVDAACAEITTEAKNAIATTINEFRAKHNLKAVTVDVDIAVASSEAKKVCEAISNMGNVPVEEETDVYLYKNNTVDNTAFFATNIIQEWIDTGKDYKYNGEIDATMKPFVRILWRHTQKVHCAINIDSTIANNGFGCRFESKSGKDYPEPTKVPTEMAAISQNLPDVPSPPKPDDDKNKDKKHDDNNKDGGKGDKKHDDNNKDGGKGDKKHSSSFERTVRTCILVVIILAFVVVALTCGVTLFAVTKIFI